MSFSRLVRKRAIYDQILTYVCNLTTYIFENTLEKEMSAAERTLSGMIVETALIGRDYDMIEEFREYTKEELKEIFLLYKEVGMLDDLEIHRLKKAVEKKQIEVDEHEYCNDVLMKIDNLLSLSEFDKGLNEKNINKEDKSMVYYMFSLTASTLLNRMKEIAFENDELLYLADADFQEMFILTETLAMSYFSECKQKKLDVSDQAIRKKKYIFFIESDIKKDLFDLIN